MAGANLTVLNGADGLSEIATGLVGQGLTIFDSLRNGIDREHSDEDEDEDEEPNRVGIAAAPNDQRPVIKAT